jgi:hypothetical protein
MCNYCNILNNKKNGLLGLVSLFLLLFFYSNSQAQELFINSEPASNMPAKSIGFRLTDKWMNTETPGLHHAGTRNMQRFEPEVMVGVNKKLMVHVAGYFSNYYQPNIQFEGVSLYAKYRFLSLDEVHQHFRMAATTKASVINNPLFFDEINLDGDNSGLSAGLVATELLHKLAISATGNYVYSLNNVDNVLAPTNTIHSLNYSLSFGYLLLPFRYKNYNQPNLNLYLEFTGKQNLQYHNSSLLDINPGIQLVLKSYMRIDLSYRFQLFSSIYRNQPNAFLVRFEYNIFNAIK